MCGQLWIIGIGEDAHCMVVLSFGINV